jgi:hypothetical protein
MGRNRVVFTAIPVIAALALMVLVCHLASARENQVTLFKPENNENINDNTPYFSWDNLDNNEILNWKYHLVISTSPTFDENIYDNANITDNQIYPGIENELPDNLYYWKVRIENDDYAGEWSIEKCFRVDTVAPVAPILVSPADGWNTNDTTPTLIWQNVDESSLPVVYTIEVDNEGTFAAPLIWSGTVDNWSTTGNSSVTLPALSDGVYYWRVRAKDNAGNENVNAWSSVRYFRLDTVPPTGSVVINGDNTYATSIHVTLTLSASDANGVSQMCFSNDGSNWTAWEAYSTSKSWTLTSGDGTKTVYVKFKDSAGNPSPAYSDSIILDTTPPTGSIVINNGSTYTTSTSVTLALSASDATSGVSQMCFSNDGSTWTDWEAYATSKSWTLSPGDGTKTVYVKFKDAAGNPSSVYSDNIILDTTPPAPPTLSGPLANAPATATGWSYTSTISSFNLSGKVDPRCRVYLNDAPLSVAADGSFSKTLSLIPGTNRFTLRIVDQAGNVTTRTLDVYYPGAPTAPSAAAAVPGVALFALSAVALIGAGVFLLIRLR